MAPLGRVRRIEDEDAMDELSDISPTWRATVRESSNRARAFDPSDLERRRPVEGDHVTLFAIPEICYWTRQGASTIRRWIASGKISADSITRPGGRIFMTGDQLARLISSWAGQPSQPTATEPKPRRRVRRHDPHKPPARGRSASS
jgi:hypothetical protein